MTASSFAAEFPAATRDHWLTRAGVVLKGAAFAEKLVSTTADGIRLEPLYGQVPGPRPARALQAPWTIFQRADHPDPARANGQALDDLANGANGLALVAKASAAARGFGIDTGKLAHVLQGVQLHTIALRVEGSGSLALADLIARQPVDPERLAVSFAAQSPEEAATLESRGFAGPFMEADGRHWHDRGATEA